MQGVEVVRIRRVLSTDSRKVADGTGLGGAEFAPGLLHEALGFRFGLGDELGLVPLQVCVGLRLLYIDGVGCL